jgi:hypothetical protein
MSADSVVHFWSSVVHVMSYANMIETAVLLAIVYDIVWHRWNAFQEAKRSEKAEKQAIEREEALEKRQVRRERQEFLRKNWQELQASLISLSRAATHMVQYRRFIREKADSQDHTTQQALLFTTTKLLDLMAVVDDRWGQVVSQLNVFPEPKDGLVLEASIVVLELGKSVENKNIEVKDETLLSLSELVNRVADKATLPGLDA